MEGKKVSADPPYQNEEYIRLQHIPVAAEGIDPGEFAGRIEPFRPDEEGKVGEGDE